MIKLDVMYENTHTIIYFVLNHISCKVYLFRPLILTIYMHKIVMNTDLQCYKDKIMLFKK